MANTGYAHRDVDDGRNDWNRHRDLRHLVDAIKRGDKLGAIMSLQRALGTDTDASLVVENEWRRK